MERPAAWYTTMQSSYLCAAEQHRARHCCCTCTRALHAVCICRCGRCGVAVFVVAAAAGAGAGAVFTRVHGSHVALQARSAWYRVHRFDAVGDTGMATPAIGARITITASSLRCARTDASAFLGEGIGQPMPDLHALCMHSYKTPATQATAARIIPVSQVVCYYLRICVPLSLQ